MSPELPWGDVAYLAFLLVGLPVLGLLQSRAARDLEIERLPVYASTVVTVAILTGVTWSVGAGEEGAAGLGFLPVAPGPMLAWSLVLVAAGLLVVAALRELGRVLGVEERPLLRRLLPRTGQERGAFVLVSLSAGVGEEIIFRGYALGTLLPVVGAGWSVAVTSVAFGVLHAYQGPLGILRTGVMGAVLAWGFLASGSLWPAVVAHALLDVLLGLVVGERLMVPPGKRGVDESEPPLHPPEP